ncbi:MAG: DUF4150 domain-containing protein [Smithella sp.]
MSEGARKGSAFMVMCSMPDVCLTPAGPSMVPIPYQIVAFMDKSTMASSNVEFGGQPAVLRDQSMIMQVVGNEAGTGGGVKSGRNVWLVEFDTASESIFINGKNLVRHNDTCWMNGKNTRGKVICTAGMEPACSISNGRPEADTNPQPSAEEEE